MTRLAVTSIIGFAANAIPLLAFALFSPGIDSEGPWGYAFLILGIVVLLGLILSALHRKWIWALVILQVALLGLMLYETFSGSALYVGT